MIFVFFYTSKILHSWHVTEDSSYSYSLFLLFIFSLVVEIIRNLTNSKMLMGAISNRFILIPIKAVLYFFIMCAIYLLMLAVMTYSTGIFLVVTTGHSLGFVISKLLSNEEGKEIEYNTSLRLLR